MLTGLRRHAEHGFTLIELIVTVVIMLTVASIAVPVLFNQRRQAQNSTAAANVGNIANIVGTSIESPDGDLLANPTGAVTGGEGKMLDGGFAGSIAIPSGYYVTWNVPERTWCADGTEGGSWFYAAQDTGGVREGTCP